MFWGRRLWGVMKCLATLIFYNFSVVLALAKERKENETFSGNRKGLSPSHSITGTRYYNSSRGIKFHHLKREGFDSQAEGTLSLLVQKKVLWKGEYQTEKWQMAYRIRPWLSTWLSSPNTLPIRLAELTHILWLLEVSFIYSSFLYFIP